MSTVKDLFQNYHRYKILKHLGIFSISVVLALSINMFLLGGQTGDYLKANVLEGTVTQTARADFWAQANGATIEFINSKAMNQVTEIGFSVNYNPESGKPAEPKLTIDGADLTEISNQPGISTYLINFNGAKDIAPNTEIASFTFEKQEDKTAYVNVINVNFKDIAGETYMLSSSGTFF